MPEIHLETNVGRSLEALVDANGLQAVVEALAAIAYEKANHIAEGWQDYALAGLWRAASRRLTTAAASKPLDALAQVQGQVRGRLMTGSDA